MGLCAARHLLRLHQPLRVHHHSSVIRNFSNSCNDDTPQKLENGYKFATGLWRRCTSRLEEFKEYHKKEVFIDSLSTFAQGWLFLQLQMPEKTHVNLVDFVSGASVASEVTLRATNTSACPEYLAGNDNSSSYVADNLKQYMTPVCYHQTALRIKKNYLHRHFYVECEAMQIEKTQLAYAKYHRLTEKEYEDWVNFNKPQTGTLSSKASVEYLRLGVNIATVEDLKVVQLTGNPRYIQQQNVYRVVFESRVTAQMQSTGVLRTCVSLNRRQCHALRRHR